MWNIYLKGNLPEVQRKSCFPCSSKILYRALQEIREISKSTYEENEARTRKQIVFFTSFYVLLVHLPGFEPGFRPWEGRVLPGWTRGARNYTRTFHSKSSSCSSEGPERSSFAQFIITFLNKKGFRVV